MKSDGGLRAEFRYRLRHLGHWVSMETGATEQGVPDLNVCIPPTGREVWIECKMTRGWTCPLRPAQVGWLLTRHRRGGSTFIATRRISTDGPRRGPAVDELWLYPGCYARELKTEGLRSPAAMNRLLYYGQGGPGSWDWNRVTEILSGD